MAKGDKQDVARAKAAVSKKKVRGEPYRSPSEPAYRSWKTVGKNDLRRSDSPWKGKSETTKAKKIANKVAAGTKTPKQLKDARVKANQVKPNIKSYSSISKNSTQVKTSFVTTRLPEDGPRTRETSKTAYQSKGKSNSAKISADNKNRRKNAANKMKAQGAKAMSAPTDRYGRSTRPKK